MTKTKQMQDECSRILQEIDTLFEFNDLKGTYLHHLFEELRERGELKKFRIIPTVKFVGKIRLERLVQRLANML